MSETSATLLVGAACLFCIGLFVLNHRRDALGAALAVVLGFDGAACALVGLAGASATRAQAAQLQSFALLVEVLGALFAGSAIALAALLRRRTGGSDLLELAVLGPQPAPGGEEEPEAEPEPVLEEPGAEEDEAEQADSTTEPDEGD